MESSSNLTSPYIDTTSLPSTPSSCVSDNYSTNHENTKSYSLSSTQTPTKNLSFSDFSCSSPSSINYDTPDEITSFLTAINTKYNVEAYSLNDVIQVIDLLLQKERKSAAKAQINEIKPQSNSIDSSIKIEISELKSQIVNIQHSNTILTNTNNTLSDKIKSLETENKSIHDAILSQQSLIEEQSTTIQKLSEQRNNLIKILHKQTDLIQKFEALPSVTKVRVQPQVRESNPQPKQNSPSDTSNDIIYSNLISIVKMISDSKFNNINEFQAIRDNAEIKPNERTMLIVKKLIDQYSQQVEVNNNNQSTIAKLNNEKLHLHDKCMEVLSLFEEQLRFLQNLSHSNDLQAAVFYNEKTGTSFYLTDCNKVELIRRCANLGSFIENTLGDITEQKFNESLQLPSSINPTGIFNLLQPTKMQEFISNMLSKITTPSDIDARQVFDILCAQIYINDLLKNYARDISIIAAKRKREIESLQQNQSNNYSQEIELMRKRDKTMRRFLLKYIEVDNPEDIPTFVLLKQFVAAAQEEIRSNQQHNYVEDSSTTSSPISIESSSTLSRKSSKSSSSSKRSQQTEAVKIEITQLQDQNNNLNQQIQQLNDEKSRMQKLLDETIHNLDLTKQETADKEKKLEEEISKKDQEISETQEKLKKSEEVCESLTKTLSENEEIVKTIKKQRKMIRKTIESLQLENKNLKQDICNCKQANTNMTNQYTESTEKLHKELENSIHEAEALTTQNSQLLTQIQQQKAQLSKLSIECKTLEMKLKSAEQKLQIQNPPKPLIDYQDLTTKVTNLTNENNSAFKILSSALVGISAPSNLIEASNFIVEFINKLKTSQLNTTNMITLLSNIRSALGIDESIDILQTIHELIQTDSNNRNNLISDEKVLRDAQIEIETIRKDLSFAQNQLVTLKQWENWARRVYGIINENSKYQIGSSEIRLNLEEALLASVSHRSIFTKLDILRSEKKSFLKFDRTILLARSNNSPLQSIRPLIILAVTLHKVQKMAGCISIAPTYQRPRTIDNEYTEFEHNRPKLKKIRSHSSRKSSNQPLIPIC